ncbi:hypothetical protein [Vibrio sp. 10N.261.52.A1]|nr:hypothetical protein [Vibrio sp. 10N.261.52.A1]
MFKIRALAILLLTTFFSLPTMASCIASPYEGFWQEENGLMVDI